MAERRASQFGAKERAVLKDENVKNGLDDHGKSGDRSGDG